MEIVYVAIGMIIAFSIMFLMQNLFNQNNKKEYIVFIIVLQNKINDNIIQIFKFPQNNFSKYLNTNDIYIETIEKKEIRFKVKYRLMQTERNKDLLMIQLELEKDIDDYNILLKNGWKYFSSENNILDL